MISDFSIDNSISKIQNPNIKEYFKEVHQTFTNGNYRSATVMLYSVLICDLVYKLRDLRDLYNDSKARSILAEIEEMQKNNPKSPDWETKLIEAIKERSSLLEPSDIVSIESLQKFRHLSAHPVLNNSDLLFSPNRETVQGLIRNILDGVLTNPPYFSNRIFDVMLDDLIETKDKIFEDEKLEKYLKTRYLDRLKDTDFKKVFRSLWKITFITDNGLSNANQEINYRALEIFIRTNKPICLESIRNEPGFYSNINKDSKVAYLLSVLAKFPEIYQIIEQPLKILVDEKIRVNSSDRLVAWYVNKDIKTHLSSLTSTIDQLEKVSSDAFLFMKDLAKANALEKEFIDFCVAYFGNSYSFYDAQDRFDSCIGINIDEFTLEQVETLLSVSNGNDQIYNRIKMKPRLQDISKRYEAQIKPELYPQIFN